MSNAKGNLNGEIRNGSARLEQGFVIRASSLIRHWSFELRHFLSVLCKSADGRP
jgi:hypothetical protein